MINIGYKAREHFLKDTISEIIHAKFISKCINIRKRGTCKSKVDQNSKYNYYAKYDKMAMF